MENPAPTVELAFLERPPSGFYPHLAEAWLKDNDALERVYPKNGFSIQELVDSYQNYDEVRRSELCDVLNEQCIQVGIVPEATKQNIERLRKKDAFCICTGQQLHVFLGPQFVLYKIWSVIRQAGRFNKLYPNYHFIPVFWMAGEDHDLDEIDFVKVFQTEYKWDLEGRRGGAAGRLKTAGLPELVAQMEKNYHLPPELLQVFSKVYAESKSFADATQALLLHFFGNEGLIVINPDNAKLKNHLKPLIEADLMRNSLGEALNKGSEKLKQAGFKPAIGARSTQLFVFEDGRRKRLDRENNGFSMAPEKMAISREELLKRLQLTPEDFSPNALLRPLYQQLVLPCAGYVCGPSELHYWHQLYEAFLGFKIPAPALLLRDSFSYCDKASVKHLLSLNLTDEQLWQGYDKAAEYLQNKLFEEIDLNKKTSDLQDVLEQIYEALHKAGSVQLKTLRKTSNEFQALLKSEIQIVNENIRSKGQYAHFFQRLEKLCAQNFNIEKPQERFDFLISYYLKMGKLSIPENYVNRGDEHLFGRISEI